MDTAPTRLCALCWKRHPADWQCVGLLEPQAMPSALPKSLDQLDYGYYWFRHHEDGSTFIACRDEGDGQWYMAAIGHPIANIEGHATLLGKVPRRVEGGGSIDQ